MKILKTFAALLLLAGVIQPHRAFGLTVGQIDTFQDGTTQNWVVNLLGMGGGAPAPVNVPNGGPGGAGDRFMQLTATGGVGPGGRLSVINFLNQWVGNYLAAGIGSIAMDANNLGQTDLFLRLMFADPNVGPPTNVAFSTDPVFLPSGGGWTSVIFPITPADLTAGLGSVEAALMNTTELRIFHSPAPGFPNPVFPIPPIVATLGVDNIEALGIPEPAALLLLGSGLAGLAALARRRST